MSSMFCVWMMSILVFFGVISLFGTLIGVHKEKYKKAGAIIAAIAFMLMCVSAAVSFVAIGYSQPYVAQTETIEIINLPSASVELIAVNDKLTEVRLLESLDGHVVGVRSYTNIEWDKTDNGGLNNLVIKKDIIEERCGCFVTDVKERTLALLS